MVETQQVAKQTQKEMSENPTIIRFNVEDVETAAEELRSKGVEVEIKVFDWGTVGCFVDPDGNRGEFKDHWNVEELKAQSV